MKIDKDSFVSIDYLIRLGENEFFPQTGQHEEISFCMGWGVMPPGLEEAILGLKVNDQKIVQLTPEQAYGEVDLELIMEVPRADFDPQLDLKVGLVFETQDEEGTPVYFTVQKVQPETVLIDFNHPLAGRDLEVSVKVREVRPATPEDLQEQQSCSACDDESHQH